MPIYLESLALRQNDLNIDFLHELTPLFAGGALSRLKSFALHGMRVVGSRWKAFRKDWTALKENVRLEVLGVHAKKMKAKVDEQLNTTIASVHQAGL